MGLDVGDVRVGVALSDPGRVIAQTWDTVRRGKDDLAQIAAIAEAEEVTTIVVGWPLTLAGEVGGQAKKVAVFADALAQYTGLPVERWDERLTTVAAQRALREAGIRERRGRQVVDKIAAALILQSWLDASRAGAP